jgi:putative toxin-antitoxin system antitoxin component (TIGR02293 family)
MLGLKSVHTSTLGMATAVSNGLPKTALKRVASEISRDPRVRQRVSDQIISRATLKRRGLRLKEEESGRLERIARLMAYAEWVWDSKADAQAFMVTSNKALNDLSPIDIATSDAGVRAVEEVLNRVYYGLPV